MGQQDQAIQTHEQGWQFSGFRSLKSKDIFQFLSSLILPLMFGIFTIVITFHQQKIAREQRLEDQNESREQWLQVRNDSREQWLQDQNDSRVQRNQELEIAIMQRDVQINAAKEQYQDEVLVAYIKEISELLKDNNGSLTSNSIMATIARAKTLNTIRQLDGLRNSHVIRFLYEAGQLTNINDTVALDISTAKLIDIDKDVLKTVTKIGKLFLRGIYLRNCTLKNTLLQNIDLSSTTHLNHVNFYAAELHDVAISFAEVSSVEFTSATLTDVNFSSSHLAKVNFSSAQRGHVHHSCARLNDVDNSFTRLINVKFASAKLQYVHFLFAKLQDVNFQFAEFKNVNFSFARLDSASFEETKIYNVDFSFAKLRHIDFSQAQLENVNFSFAELSDVKFSLGQLVNVNFSSAILRDVTFAGCRFYNAHFPFAILVSVTFSITMMHNTNFLQVRRMIAKFDNADLSMSIFSHANVKGASFYGFTSNELTTVNFSNANLQNTTFTKIKLTQEQLRSALSIRDAQLPDGTLGRDPNLIKNGEADCNSFRAESWELKIGNVTVTISEKNRNNCHFVLQSYVIGAVMVQRISLSKVWDSHIWSYSKAVLNAQMGDGVSIYMKGMDSSEKILTQGNSSSIGSNITMKLQKEMQTLEILVEFRAHFNNSWCDDIELFIDYDTETEPLTVPPLRGNSIDIHPNAKWTLNGITVAGGNGQGNGNNQLNPPMGLYVDDYQTIYAADYTNHRIMEWKCGATSGKVVAGGNGQGNETNQLNKPFDVIVGKERDSLIICDGGNRKVVRWPLRNGAKSGKTIISNIDCNGLTMDENGFLYVVISVISRKLEVRRYTMDDSEGTVVARENGGGSGLNQINILWHVFVDRNHSVYVSEYGNNRVMKWEEGAKEGLVVAGGNGRGSSLTQLQNPRGVVVDELGTVYVADYENNRIMRWRKGSREGSVIAGGNGQGGQSNQFYYPAGLSFDRYGNLYVADMHNHRVQKFQIEQTIN